MHNFPDSLWTLMRKHTRHATKMVWVRSLRKSLLTAFILGGVWVGTPPALANLKHDARSVGHTLGSVTHDVGHTAKHVGLAVGHKAKKVGIAIGHAAKAGGLAFWHAAKGR